MLRSVGATGGAWAFRRSALEAVGGLLDICILGHGDWSIAFGLVCQDARDVGFPKYHDAYCRDRLAKERSPAKEQYRLYRQLRRDSPLFMDRRCRGSIRRAIRS